MRLAYADPPYLGTSSFGAQHHYGALHDEARVYDTIDGHKALVERLCDEFDGWALSLHTPSLRLILPLCPDDVRVGAWVKPFASFKPGVNPGYCWEPVIFWRPRPKRDRADPTVRDYVSCNIALERGFPGAKPEAFTRWILDLLGVRRGVDEFHDLFPGSGAVQRAYEAWLAQPELTEVGS